MRLMALEAKPYANRRRPHDLALGEVALHDRVVDVLVAGLDSAADMDAAGALEVLHQLVVDQVHAELADERKGDLPGVAVAELPRPAPVDPEGVVIDKDLAEAVALPLQRLDLLDALGGAAVARYVDFQAVGRGEGVVAAVSALVRAAAAEEEGRVAVLVDEALVAVPFALRVGKRVEVLDLRVEGVLADLAAVGVGEILDIPEGRAGRDPVEEVAESALSLADEDAVESRGLQDALGGDRRVDAAADLDDSGAEFGADSRGDLLDEGELRGYRREGEDLRALGLDAAHERLAILMAL